MLAGACGLALVVTLVGTFDLGRYALWDPDEARHAEIAREMLHGSGLAHWWVPTLEFQPYREKPAPYYWFTSTAYRLLGETELAARAPSAVMAIVTVLAVYGHAAPRVGVAGGLAAAAVLATQAGWFWIARLGTLDMTFTAWITLAVLSGLGWLERNAPREPPWFTYAATGIAVLVKGPLALVLVGAPLLAAASLDGRWSAWRDAGLGRGALLVATIAAIFYVPAALLDPAYVAHFAHTHLRRLEATAPHNEPVWFYLAWLPAVAAPWTGLAIPAALAAARRPYERVWLAWAGIVPALMTLVSSKLVTYLLPGLPPLALVVGAAVGRWATAGPAPEERRAVLGATGLTIVACVAGAIAAVLARPAYSVLPARIAVSASCAAAAAALVWAIRCDRLGRVPAVVGGSALLIHLLAVRLLAPAVSAVHSDAAMAAAIATRPDASIVAFDTQAPSLAFYARRPAAHTSRSKDLAAFAATGSPLFVVVGNRQMEAVERALGPRAHLWMATPRRRLYGTIPPPPTPPGSG